MNFSRDIKDNMDQLQSLLNIRGNFDVVYRVIRLGGREACLYFIDGLTKDDTLLKILQAFSSIKEEDFPPDAHSFSKQYLPYGEIGLLYDQDQMIARLQGRFCGNSDF